MKHLIDFPERWKRTVGLGLLIVALGVFVTATAGASRLRAVAKKGSSRSGGDHGTPSQAATGSLGCSSGSGLCLNGGRFQVEATWKAPDGSSGAGNAVALTSDSGYFWFFDPNNVELVVKVLNGCDVNGQYWFFSGGLTNLEVGITVTDTATGVVKTYSSPQGTAFQPVIDTAAFGACPHGEASISTGNPEEPAEGASVARPARAPSAMRTFALGCVGTDTALCIDGRFQIEATWQTASGASGLAHAAPLTSGSGYFWFFEPSNVELIVKTLNACSIDQGNWFFAAGLTNVAILLSITDTFTGEARTYTNPPGTPFLPIQDTGAFAFCPTPTPTPTTTQTPTRTPTRPRAMTYTPTVTPSLGVPNITGISVESGVVLVVGNNLGGCSSSWSAECSSVCGNFGDGLPKCLSGDNSFVLLQYDPPSCPSRKCRKCFGTGSRRICLDGPWSSTPTICVTKPDGNSACKSY